MDKDIKVDVTKENLRTAGWYHSMVMWNLPKSEIIRLAIGLLASVCFFSELEKKLVNKKDE
jgi:hypothetical protein